MKTIYKKEGAVSEVVGSLLILAITVMLFSTVLIYVSDLPTPEAKISADFEAQLDIGVSNFGNITVTSRGGESLDLWRTTFIFNINDDAYQHRLDSSVFNGQTSLADGKFSIGESFYYNSSWDSETIGANDKVAIYLFDETTGNIVWYSALQGILTDWKPKILDVHTSPTTASVGNTVTFTAKIFEPNPDQQGDMSGYHVYVDLSSLNLGNKESMTYTGKSGGAGIFTCQKTIPSISNGVYTIRASVDVTDDGVYEDNKTATITIGTESTPITQTLCDLSVRDTDIVLGDTSPTHMSDVTVTVTISNYGGKSAIFSLYVNDTYPDGTSVPINSSRANPLDGNLIAAGGQTIISFTWEDVGGSGPTEVIIHYGFKYST